MLDTTIYHYVMPIFVSDYSLCFKVYSSFLLISSCMNIFFRPFTFLISEISCRQHKDGNGGGGGLFFLIHLATLFWFGNLVHLYLIIKYVLVAILLFYGCLVVPLCSSVHGLMTLAYICLDSFMSTVYVFAFWLPEAYIEVKFECILNFYLLPPFLMSYFTFYLVYPLIVVILFTFLLSFNLYTNNVINSLLLLYIYIYQWELHIYKLLIAPFLFSLKSLYFLKGWFSGDAKAIFLAWKTFSLLQE